MTPDRSMGPALHPLVMLVGTVATVAIALVVLRVDASNEDYLVEQRTNEAGEVLEASVSNIEIPLKMTSALARGSPETEEAFRSVAETQIGPEAQFVSESLWRVGRNEPLVVVGEAPQLARRPGPEIEAFLERAAQSDEMTVLGLLDGEQRRIGYAYTGPMSGPGTLLVYAEQPLPPEPVTPVPPDTAFVGLNYAIYLGDDEIDDALLLASTPDLPMAGRRAQVSVPFGDTTLLLVMSPSEHLGGDLLGLLPWIILGTGLAMTLGGAALTGRLHRRRRQAERLAAENERLYLQQRDVAHALQQSLLPRRLPDVPGVELAARYVAGVAGTEVGGDWYDTIRLDGTMFVVTGDVSGRGIEAASVMASIRYGIRTLAIKDQPPDAILADVNSLAFAERNGHFATALCAMVDIQSRTATFANAGHPPPLVVSPSKTEFIHPPSGPPIGVVGGARYETLTVTLPHDATLLLITDGLFERKRETIDVGLERVREVAAQATGTLEELLDRLVAELVGPHSTDDAAILALRWTT